MKDRKNYSPLYKSFIYSMRGLAVLLKKEWHIYLIISGLIPVIISGILLKLETAEFILTISAVWLVLIVEVINTAIEELTNKVSPEYDKIAGRVKDIASASVFLSITLGLFIYLYISISRLVELLQ